MIAMRAAVMVALCATAWRGTHARRATKFTSASDMRTKVDVEVDAIAVSLQSMYEDIVVRRTTKYVVN